MGASRQRDVPGRSLLQLVELILRLQDNRDMFLGETITHVGLLYALQIYFLGTVCLLSLQQCVSVGIISPPVLF